MESPAHDILKPCTKPGCRHLTRSSRYKLSDFPGTYVRMRGGVCTCCYDIGDLPCADCGVQMRPAQVPASLAPGRKQRYADNMCDRCWRAHNLAPVGERREPATVTTPEQVEYAKRGLEAFLARRRDRLGVAA